MHSFELTIFVNVLQDRNYVEISSAYVSVTKNVFTSNTRDYYSFRCVLSKLLPEEEGSYKYKVSVSPLTREIEVNGTFQISKFFGRKSGTENLRQSIFWYTINLVETVFSVL